MAIVFAHKAMRQSSIRRPCTMTAAKQNGRTGPLGLVPRLPFSRTRNYVCPGRRRIPPMHAQPRWGPSHGVRTAATGRDSEGPLRVSRFTQSLALRLATIRPVNCAHVAPDYPPSGTTVTTAPGATELRRRSAAIRTGAGRSPCLPMPAADLF
jgi:hypothetical protein